MPVVKVKEDCVACKGSFSEDSGCAVMTRPGTGPSFASAGGDPPEYDWVCFLCQEGAEQEYDYDPALEEEWYDDGCDLWGVY